MFRTRARDAAPVEPVAPDVYPTEDNGFGSHALHATDASCARCNRALTENDEARRRADGSYVHLCC
jgi:hypothetical protein